MRSRKILVVDHDEALRTALAEQLHSEEIFETETAGSADSALAAIAQTHFDVILIETRLIEARLIESRLIDISMGNQGQSDMNGLELCREMRLRNVRTPIIMMTAADAEAETIQGLDSGANDSIAKPFRLGVLLARIKSQLRQHENSDDAVLTINRYSFRPGAKVLADPAGHRIRLTEKETAILKYLFRAGDRPTARETLLNEVWGYNAGVTTHTLETHIYRLRQKIEADPSRAVILITEAGGYRLVP